MADRQGQSPQNWLERRPKQTIVWSVLILILAAACGAEKLLADVNHTHNPGLSPERRSSDLTETLPGVETLRSPRIRPAGLGFRGCRT